MRGDTRILHNAQEISSCNTYSYNVSFVSEKFNDIDSYAIISINEA